MNANDKKSAEQRAALANFANAKKRGGRRSVKEGLIDSPLGSPGILTQLYAADGLFVGFALCRSHHI